MGVGIGTGEVTIEPSDVSYIEIRNGLTETKWWARDDATMGAGLWAEGYMIYELCHYYVTSVRSVSYTRTYRVQNIK